MSYVSLEDIKQSVESGIIKALKTYEKMTPDIPLSLRNHPSESFVQRIPESFIQSHIALALKGKCFVSLETTPSTLRAALGKPGPEPDNKSNRYDIVIWWKDPKKGARIAIEIKRVHREINCNYDTEKLREAIERGWVERGMIVVYATARQPKTITERFDGICKNIERKSGKKIEVDAWYYEKPRKLDGEKDYWGATCFEMHKA